MTQQAVLHSCTTSHALTVSLCVLQGSGAALSIENQREQADGSDDDEDDAPALEAPDREQFSIPKLLKQHIVEVSSQPHKPICTALPGFRLPPLS